MNPSLAEALALLNLRLGEVYRMTVNGRAVEVRALETDPSAECGEEPPPSADVERIDPWLDLPPSAPVRVVTVRGEERLWPAPFHLDELPAPDEAIDQGM